MTLAVLSRASRPRAGAPSPAIPPAWDAAVPHATGLYTGLGVGLIAALLLGFGWWGGAAPIAGAVVANGVFTAGGQNKTIQSLDGGVIAEIALHEGDTAEAGQVLLRLDDTAARAELHRLLLRRDHLAMLEARLVAEAGGRDELPGPIGSPDDRDAARAALADNERLTFATHRQALLGDISALRNDVEALREKLAGTSEQRDATLAQMGLLQQELDAKAFLLQGGDIRKSEVLALQRAVANARGEAGRLQGDIGDIKERIARAEGQIAAARNGAVRAATEQLSQVRAEAGDIDERIVSARAVLDRTTVRSPVRGTVLNLRYHAVGGVVEPGKAIMEVVPSGEDLLIEARVRPQDIVNLRPGQEAAIRLSALDARVTPQLAGSLVYVSADTQTDERHPRGAFEDGYVARVRLADGAAVRGFKPQPGMPAEVFFKTSERTFLQYLLKPLRESLQRAFRER